MGIADRLKSVFSRRKSIEKDPDEFIANVLKDLNEKIPIIRELVSNIDEKIRQLGKPKEDFLPGKGENNINSFSLYEPASGAEHVVELEIARNRALDIMNRYIARGRENIKQAMLFIENSHGDELMNRCNSILSRFQPIESADKTGKEKSNGRYQHAIVKAQTICSLASSVSRSEVSSKVLETGEIAVKIINSFEQGLYPGYLNSQFLNYYLDAAVKTVKGYLEIQGKTGESEYVDKLIEKAEMTVNSIHGSFGKLLAGISKTEYLDFDLEMDLLRKTLHEID